MSKCCFKSDAFFMLTTDVYVIKHGSVYYVVRRSPIFECDVILSMQRYNRPRAFKSLNSLSNLMFRKNVSRFSVVLSNSLKAKFLIFITSCCD